MSAGWSGITCFSPDWQFVLSPFSLPVVSSLSTLLIVSKNQLLVLLPFSLVFIFIDFSSRLDYFLVSAGFEFVLLF
jgi:hypothetical protein